LPSPATVGGFSEYSAPTQIVTGSPDLISGRVADRVDAIHVYRDLDGNGVLDPGSDGLLHADTTPADGYAFHAGSLPSGRHVLYVAAMKDGAVAGSITTTLVAARWWSVSISSLIDGESRLPTTGDLVADPTDPTMGGQAGHARRRANHASGCGATLQHDGTDGGLPTATRRPRGADNPGSHDLAVWRFAFDSKCVSRVACP
jgi:hypothetical protein